MTPSWCAPSPDANGDGVCTAGEPWGEVEATINDDDTASVESGCQQNPALERLAQQESQLNPRPQTPRFVPHAACAS